MKIFDTYKDIGPEFREAVIVIGNFDGVHRGHRILLDKGRELADKTGKKLAVLTFEPHPRQLFRPDEPPVRLTPLDVKAWRLEEAGVAILFSLKFDWDFASQTAQEFIDRILKNGLAASHVVIGYDFRFGQLRKGSTEDIKAAGIPVTIIEEIKDTGGEKFSSSRIRELLSHGKIAEASALLGWDWEIRGTVTKGDQRGRELGFPTANIALGDTIHPSYGIYAALVNIEGESQWRPAAVNIGIRPMFEVPIAQVESYIFDFSREIYGKTLRVRPIERIRGEAKFKSVQDLIKQMEQDCEQAQDILSAF